MQYEDLNELMQRRVERTPNEVALPQQVLDSFNAACDQSRESSEAAFQRGHRWLAAGGPTTATVIPVDEQAECGMLDVVIHPTGEGCFSVTFPITLVAVLYNLFGLLGPFPSETRSQYEPFTIGDLLARDHPWMRCRTAWKSYTSLAPRERRATLLGSITGRHQSQQARLAALEPLATKITAGPGDANSWIREPLMFITAHEVGHAISRHWSFDLSADDESSMTPDDFERCCELEADHGAILALMIENVLPHSGSRISRLIDDIAIELYGRNIRGLSEAETDRFQDAISPPLMHYMDLAQQRFKERGNIDDEPLASAGAFRALMGAVISISLQSLSESVDDEPSTSLLAPEYRYQLAAHHVAPSREIRSAFMSEFCRWCDAAAHHHELPDLRMLSSLSFSSEALLGSREDLRLKAVYRIYAKLRPHHQKTFPGPK